jgi:hypothetical protein
VPEGSKIFLSGFSLPYVQGGLFTATDLKSDRSRRLRWRLGQDDEPVDCDAVSRAHSQSQQSKPVDKVRPNLEKFVLEESKKIAKEKSENSDDMRMLLRPRSRMLLKGDEGGLGGHYPPGSS